MEQDIEHGGIETAGYSLEVQQVFSRSLLWDLQQRYFSERGVEAWRQGEVPHYITSNPSVANSYAEIVFAFWHDLRRLMPTHEPLYLCELGAGSGRFAFHFLRRLTYLCEQANLAPTSFRYVLTDFAPSILDFWRQHTCFQAFFDKGMLDLALFDIRQSDQISLQVSGETISAESLSHPLVVIANYVFDSVPQDFYYIDDQRCQEGLISLSFKQDPSMLASTQLLNHLRIRYDYRVLTEKPYQECYLQQILAEYQRTLIKTHLLFPAAGLRCLYRLQALSRHGLLVLSADKGEHRLSALQGASAPLLVHHGSFSLMVNYHAFKRFCEQRGGLALFPDRHHYHINVGCLLVLKDAMAFWETRRAYQRSVQEFGPDDFYSIITHTHHLSAKMSVEEILAYLRLTYFDSQQCARYMPRLLELAPTFDANERREVSAAIEKVWEMYFPLGESVDLAFHIASLLYAMDEYQRALTYFERSTALYGQHTGTLYKRAVCHQLLGQYEQAEQLLRTVVRYDPENQPARALLVHLIHYQPVEEPGAERNDMQSDTPL